MHWEYLIIGFITVMAIITILFGKLKIHPSHSPDAEGKQDGTKNEPKG